MTFAGASDLSRSNLKGLMQKAAQSVLHQYPLYSGVFRIANYRPMVWLADRGKTVGTLRTGAQIWIDTADVDGRAIYFFGEQDPKITWICRRVLRAGDTALDVGANCGLMALTCAHLVGKSGAVHAFEPQPELAEGIVRSAALNDYGQVHVHPVALSEADETRDLFFWVTTRALDRCRVFRAGSPRESAPGFP